MRSSAGVGRNHPHGAGGGTSCRDKGSRSQSQCLEPIQTGSQACHSCCVLFSGLLSAVPTGCMRAVGFMVTQHRQTVLSPLAQLHGSLALRVTVTSLLSRHLPRVQRAWRICCCRRGGPLWASVGLLLLPQLLSGGSSAAVFPQLDTAQWHWFLNVVLGLRSLPGNHPGPVPSSLLTS